MLAWHTTGPALKRRRRYRAISRLSCRPADAGARLLREPATMPDAGRSPIHQDGALGLNISIGVICAGAMLALARLAAGSFTVVMTAMTRFGRGSCGRCGCRVFLTSFMSIPSNAMARAFRQRIESIGCFHRLHRQASRDDYMTGDAS